MSTVPRVGEEAESWTFVAAAVAHPRTKACALLVEAAAAQSDLLVLVDAEPPVEGHTTSKLV